MSRKESVNKQPGDPSARQQAGNSWQFVNVSGRKETQSVQNRRLVRANAARVYWRAQKKDGMQSRTEGLSNSEEDNFGQAQASFGREWFSSSKGNDVGRTQASFVRLVHRNSANA